MSNNNSDIIIVQPISIKIYATVSCLLALTICLFLYFGSYTQKQHITGILVPDKGLMKIFSPEAGTISALNVKEGDHVEKGDLLYAINSNQVSAFKENNYFEIKDKLTRQIENIDDELSRHKSINEEIITSSKRKISGLEHNLKNLNISLNLISEQIKISEDTLLKYQNLAKDGLYSKIQVQEKHIELLNRQYEYSSLLSEKSLLESNIYVSKQEIESINLSGDNKLSEIQRSKSILQQKLIEFSPERVLNITSPASGTIAGIHFMPGQYSSGTTPLLNILPKGSYLQAELYAPSNAISFIKPGNKVLLRYRAFPYQKFGQHTGIVTYVSKAAVPIAEINNSSLQVLNNAPVYRITVELPKQFIMAYGKKEGLQAGMEVEAYILLDTRKLYEWMFEPLFSITG